MDRLIVEEGDLAICPVKPGPLKVFWTVQLHFCLFSTEGLRGFFPFAPRLELAASKRPSGEHFTTLKSTWRTFPMKRLANRLVTSQTGSGDGETLSCLMIWLQLTKRHFISERAFDIRWRETVHKSSRQYDSSVWPWGNARSVSFYNCYFVQLQLWTLLLIQISFTSPPLALTNAQGKV